MQCHQCQHENPDGSRFCNACGHNLATTTSLVQSEPRPVAEAERSPLDPSLPEAERRQLTVMFCDLVGSTSLSDELDPEELREVVRAYQATCTEVIQRYDGHVAQHLGDGLLVYFGYPQAHEDDPQRAVHTGLGIIESLKHLNVCLAADNDIHLSVRVGIHTGLVVVGQIGSGDRQEQLALGAAPNVAARIQGLAEPDRLIISHATYQLVQRYFNCDSLGEHDLRGVTQPIAVYQVLGDSGIQNRLDIASTRGLTPLVGRESESTLLFDRWEQVKDGQGQVVLLSGEAGIGKSRLVQALKDHIAEEAHIRLECRSLPYFTNSALYPIIDMVQRTFRFQTDDTPEQKLEKLKQNLSQFRLPLEETVPLFATLLSLPLPEDSYAPLSWTPRRQRQKTLETIVVMLLKQAEQQPVLFILEDLHWTDPTTLELLDLLIDQTPTAFMCALLTCRPEFQPIWSHRSNLTEVTVSRLSQPQIARIAEQVAGEKRLPDEIVQQLVNKTDGVPLYVEEMTKAILESGILKEVDGQYELTATISTLAIPATLQDSLMARLDRLVTAKVLAQQAAVIGRQFSYIILQAVYQLDDTILERELGLLVDAELIYQRGIPPQATYIFKHALVTDTAYNSLLRSTRQGYHRRIAEVLEEQFPEASENQPELLAHHYTESGLIEQAVGYWQQAGEQSMRRSAHAEAIGHFRKGLEVVQRLPKTPERTRHELLLHTAIGPALMLAKGQADPEVEHVYTQARSLCDQVEDLHQLSLVLTGLWRYYHAQGAFQEAQKLGEELLTFARRHADNGLLLVANWILGATLACRGDLLAARAHLEAGINCYDPRQHQDLIFIYGTHPALACHSYAVWTLWMLGYPDLAMKGHQEELRVAQGLSPPPPLIAIGHNMHAMLYLFYREGHIVQALAERAITLCTEHGLPYPLAWGTALRGVALLMQHQEEGLEQLQQGLTAYQETGIRLFTPCFLALLAEAYGTGGKIEEGLSSLTEAFLTVDNCGSYFFEAELYRLKGQLLLQQSSNNAAAAESCFHQAITIALNQSAKSWELRAATSLARLWQSQDKRQDAYELIAPVYGWFTEGFDTADLQDAKSLLDELEK